MHKRAAFSSSPCFLNSEGKPAIFLFVYTPSHALPGMSWDPKAGLTG
jgi:hypothetical protein